MDASDRTPTSNLVAIGWSFWVIGGVLLAYAFLGNDEGGHWRAMAFGFSPFAGLIGTMCLCTDVIVKAINRR